MFKRGVVVFAMAVLVGAGGGVRLDASEPLKAIVGSYLDIQAQLVADKTDTVRAQAHAIGEQARGMGQGGADIARAAADVEKASDLKTTRDAFAVLSDAVIAAAKAEGWKDVSDLKLAWCPMVKHSWLQKGDKIQNPYYGKAMPGCGEIRKLQ